MDEPDWGRRGDSDVLVWHLPGEETAVPVPKKQPTLKAAAGVLIIISALITGSVFGLLMMNAVPERTATKAAPVLNSSTEQTAASVEKTVPLFVVQGGIFSTKEAAATAVSSAEEPAAVMQSEDQYSMIYGAFFTKAEADEAERNIESTGSAAYVKETSAILSLEQEEELKKAAETNRLDEIASLLSP
ncbi:hypothetical protein [Domibacillus indicus]|uniref:hypothetical protein n=1 Tax=Domibacillus indicus TaxID=1437523 RepID=UPI000617E969|nr:hypothetical protein [Domibacillus indicus]